LGHSDLATTLGHYEQSSMLAAGANLASTMEAIQQKSLSEDEGANQEMVLPFLGLGEVLS
jgi:hypothetical protein